MTYKILKPLLGGLFTGLIESPFVLTQEKLKELLEHDPKRGKFTWKTTRNYKVRIGVDAGTPDTYGHVQIRVNGKKYLDHHLVWLYYYGKFPEQQIDHIDGDPSNNRLENLREVSSSVNNRNRKIPCTNTSGLMGVHHELREQNGKVCNRWVASWCDSAGKGKSKSFSVLKFGYETARTLAADFRALKIQERNDEGAGYSERHGSHDLK